MKTTSVYVSTLCVPCENRCRYCLLSYDGKVPGADYDRSREYALSFYSWIRENRPEISFQFYFGYSMEHPKLLETIDFSRSIGSAGGEFLQFDGMKFRTEAQTRQLLEDIQHHGIHLIDLTFYGTSAYHDRFAARQGDFDFMLLILKTANEIGLDVSISIPTTAENAGQMEELLDLFSQYTTQRITLFVPHREGRGANLEKARLSAREYDALSDRVKAHFNTRRFRTEQQWLEAGKFDVPEKRMLGLTLTRENIAFFENQPFEDTIAWLEQLDDAYYRAVPSLPELASRYGDKNGDRFYSQRDLYLYYQHRYIQEHGLSLYDINDERQCFSRRF